MLEFRPDTSVVETWKTPDVLGLHPRDVYLFASDVGVGQRATLAARSGAILMRTDVCKAIVYHDKAVLFPARSAAQHNVSQHGEAWRHRFYGLGACAYLLAS